MVRWMVTGSFYNIFPPNVHPKKRYRAERINPFPTRRLAKYQFLRPAVGALPDLARYTDNLQKAGVESSFCFLDGIPPIML